MAKDSCIMYPTAEDGKDSKMYRDLLKMDGIDKPLANYIYAMYLLPGVAEDIDAYFGSENSRNSQNQHSANKVFNYFNVTKLLDEGSATNINILAINEHAKNSAYQDILYDSSEDAMAIATRINNKDVGAVAYVVRTKDMNNETKFIVRVVRKDGNTLHYVSDVKIQQKAWDVLKTALMNRGIDTNNPLLDKEVFNATNAEAFVSVLVNTRGMDSHYYNTLDRSDVYMLVGMNEGSPRIQELKNRLSIPSATNGELANLVYNILKNNNNIANNYTAGQKGFIKSSLEEFTKYVGNTNNPLTDREIQNIQNEIADVKDTVAESKESQVNEIIKELKEKFPNLGKEDIVLGKDALREIRTMKQAISLAITSVEIQKRDMVNKQGITPESKDMQVLRRELEKSLNAANYAYGVISYLYTAYDQINKAINDLPNINTSGTDLEANAALAEKILNIRNLSEYYRPLAQAFSNLDALAGSNLIGNVDKTTLENAAKRLVKELDRFNEESVENVAKQTMVNLTTYALGEKIGNGIPIATLVEQMNLDSTIWDFLYSWSRVSNPLVAAMGTIVKNMQNERDLVLGNLALRIRRAHNRARRKGVKNTRFMYEDNGYIVSDRDYTKFNEAKRKQWGKLKNRYSDPFIIDELMQQWEFDNTEEREVDSSNGRTERVPNATYAKPFPQLSEAELEYYRDMMQIKGELGSLLPKYAQKQFLAPQKRRSFVDALSDARRHRSLKKLIKAIRVKIGNIYKIREDDINFASTGVVNGEEFGIMEGGLDSKELKKIPIHYINRIQDTDELMKDFSGALQHLASTAVNYAFMSRITGAIQFMEMYMNDRNADMKQEGLKRKDVIALNKQVIIRSLKGSKVLTPRLMEEFIDCQLFGRKLHKEGKWTKFWLSMLGYTSRRHLSVNLKGAIGNELVGELQMIIEAGAGQFYNSKDLLWAHGMLIGEAGKAIGGVGKGMYNAVTGDKLESGHGAILDYAFNNETSMPVVLARFFDPINENFDNVGRGRYHTNILRHLISEDLSFMGYGVGEHMIHYMNMYAVLKHIKVTQYDQNGNHKKVSLYSILGKSENLDGSAHLTWDTTATYTDENGVEKPVDLDFLKQVKEQIRYVNQTTHGSMNSEDKGVIHRYIAGRFMMNLRQWMVEHYSRRFRKEHWDAALRKNVEGYHRTFNKALKNTILNNGGLSAVNFVLRALHQECIDFDADVAVRFGNLSVDQKANVRRAMREYVLLAALSLLNLGLGDPKDHQDEWMYRMLIYQVRRALLDIKGGTPIFLPFEATTLINNPISATATFTSLLYPFFGIPDLWADDIQSGPYKGWNRFAYKFMRYTVPYWYQIEQMIRLGEDESLLNFDRSIV